MKATHHFLVILVGIIYLAYGFFLLGARTTPLSIPKDQPNWLQPAHTFTLAIPSADIYLPVYRANISAGKWETTDKGVSYLSTSPLPGNVGNTVLYGHNWPNILGNLHEVKPGDQIIISDLFASHTFTVKYVAVVGPNQRSVYAPTTDHRLTLYTCAGFLDSQRLVVTALANDSLL